MAGIYIHIPFCKQACAYCDFHFSTLLKNKSELINAICREIELRKDYLETREINTIYFGGGTPSLLQRDEIEKIFSALKKHYDWNESTEITFECNPDDLSEEKLRELKEIGINRLSIGLQSFNDDELKWMNRAHNAHESEASVLMAKALGFDNITIDLIYGSKFTSIETWKNTLQKAIDLNVPHISSYNLTIEEKTKLGIGLHKGTELPVDDEKSAEQFEVMVEMLEANGYEHYEISNFAKPGFISKHNSNYWRGQKYIGLGPSAHSYNGISRQWNVANNNLYVKGITLNQNYFEIETLSALNKYDEYVLTGLRTKWGCDLNFIENNFGEEFKQHFLLQVKKMIPATITRNENIFTLNNKGKLLADKIAMELFF